MPALATHPRPTNRLVLRPFRRRDVDSLVAAVHPSLPELQRWLPWAHPAYDRSDAAAFIRESVRSWQEGRAYDFAIRRHDEPDRHLGNISIWFLSRGFRVGEIGYWTRTDETSRGICTEAAVRMLELAYDELDMHRVTLRIAVGNRASERVAEKLGFVREGLLREEVKVQGQWLDHSVWGLLEHEYRRSLPEYAERGWSTATQAPS